MPEETKKMWYTSKTLWTNFIAIIGIIISDVAGYNIDPKIQGGILVGINWILRMITKKEIVWKTNP